MADIVKRITRPSSQPHQTFFDQKNDATNLRRQSFRREGLLEPGRSCLPRPTEAKVKQADEESRGVQAEISRSFNHETFWAVDTTLSWIAFRHPDRLLVDWRIATLYKGKPRPQKLLLDALQEGRLTAFDRNGAVILPEFWGYVNERDLPQRDFRVRRSQVQDVWSAEDGLATSRRSRGRRPNIEDKSIEAEVFKLMDHHGDFVGGDPDWNAQAKLEAAISEQCNLSMSRARARIKKPLEKWRRQKRLANPA